MRVFFFYVKYIYKYIYQKLDHCVMQFQGFDWRSGHGVCAIIT